MSHYDEDKLLERARELGEAERERHLEKYEEPPSLEDVIPTDEDRVLESWPEGLFDVLLEDDEDADEVLGEILQEKCREAFLDGFLARRG